MPRLHTSEDSTAAADNKLPSESCLKCYDGLKLTNQCNWLPPKTKEDFKQSRNLPGQQKPIHRASS
jgi:hypothetical protein